MWTPIIPIGTQLVLTGFKFHLEVQVQKYELLGNLRVITLSNGETLISRQDSAPDRWLLLRKDNLNYKQVRIKDE